MLARVALAKEEISLWGPGELMTGTSAADGFVSLLSSRAGRWGWGRDGNQDHACHYA